MANYKIFLSEANNKVTTFISNKYKSTTKTAAVKKAKEIVKDYQKLNNNSLKTFRVCIIEIKELKNSQKTTIYKYTEKGLSIVEVINTPNSDVDAKLLAKYNRLKKKKNHTIEIDKSGFVSIKDENAENSFFSEFKGEIVFFEHRSLLGV